MKGKTVLITGANSGIGKSTAALLASQGAHIVMLCRSHERAEEARNEIIKQSGNSHIDILPLDLLDLTSVRNAAAQINTSLKTVDVLINNAGGHFAERMLTPDGIEFTFGMNHLGHFLLTHLLLPKMKEAPKARIINVSSDAHIQGEIQFDNLMAEKSFVGWKAYCNAKLANIYFTYELARRLNASNVTVNALHPGMVYTNFRHGAKGLFKLAIKLATPFMISSKNGAATSVFLSSSDEVRDVSGKYFVKKKERRSIRASYQLETATRLWEVSRELCGEH